MFSVDKHLGEFGEVLFGKILKLNLGIWEKALSEIGNNEVLANESLLLDTYMHGIRNLDSWKFILEARIGKACPYTHLRMLPMFRLAALQLHTRIIY